MNLSVPPEALKKGAMEAAQKAGNSPKPAKSGFDGYLTFGFLIIFALIGGFAAWSILAPIQGAIIAPGTVVVEGKPRTLQHLDGGIVGEILVRDGDSVQSGDVVMRLDATSLTANRDLLQKRSNEARVLRTRLIAERDNVSRIDWSAAFPPQTRDPELDTIITDQNKLFITRREAYTGEVAQLEKRAQQYSEQIDGLNAQIRSSQRQREIIAEELSGLQTLLEKGYVSQTRVLALQREQAAFDGAIASYESDIARATTAIGETEIQRLQVRRTAREQVLTELRSTESQISDLQEQLITASDQVERIDILAPVSGRVHNMTITTLGGVVAPTEPIMQIIPDTDRLIVEAQVEPASIDQIYQGQPTTVRMSAFNQRTTPELNGVVIDASANTVQDPATGFAYYIVKVEIPQEELSRLSGLQLVPGMPAECFMQTDQRSAMNYLLKPATDQLSRAFREE